MTQVTKTDFIDYPIAIGVRLRLTPEQKQMIKDRYSELSSMEVKEETTGRGGIKVVTASNPTQLIQKMGCDRFTLASLLGTQERLQVGQIQKWERALDIQLLDKKTLDEAWKSYMRNLGVK